MGQPITKQVAIEDYLTIERKDDQKYEFHEGELLAMAGGTLNHTTICNNISGELRNAVRSKGTCVSFNSEMKLEVKRAGRYVYPDAGVACPEFKESDTISGAIVNPRIVVEVLSESSGEYDRGAKWRYYFSMSTVREYLIIEQAAPRVTLHRRAEGNSLFHIEVIEGLDATLVLDSIGAEIAMAEVYRDVALVAEEI